MAIAPSAADPRIHCFVQAFARAIAENVLREIRGEHQPLNMPNPAACGIEAGPAKEQRDERVYSAP